MREKQHPFSRCLSFSNVVWVIFRAILTLVKQTPKGYLSEGLCIMHFQRDLTVADTGLNSRWSKPTITTGENRNTPFLGDKHRPQHTASYRQHIKQIQMYNLSLRSCQLNWTPFSDRINRKQNTMTSSHVLIAFINSHIAIPLSITYTYSIDKQNGVIL